MAIGNTDHIVSTVMIACNKVWYDKHRIYFIKYDIKLIDQSVNILGYLQLNNI